VIQNSCQRLFVDQLRDQEPPAADQKERSDPAQYRGTAELRLFRQVGCGLRPCEYGGEPDDYAQLVAKAPDVFAQNV
jgi:hypothetical protein